jgi:hypothetical protein
MGVGGTRGLERDRSEEDRSCVPCGEPAIVDCGEDTASLSAAAVGAWDGGGLVGAMRLAQPGDPAVPELFAAAKSIHPDSPTYVTVTYDRLRLAQGAVGGYNELTTLLPGFQKNETRSTINAFVDLEIMNAPTLNRFLSSAALLPGSDGDVDGGEGVPLVQPAIRDYRRPTVEICGVDLTSPMARHLDLDATLLLNQRMPLRLLQAAALSNTLPKNLQFEVAHVAWTRAVLLNDWKTARALSPVLSNCQAARSRSGWRAMMRQPLQTSGTFVDS